MEITKDIFKVLTFYQWRHHNMGYKKDEHGNYTDEHKGYGWTLRSDEMPRVTFTEYYMMPDRADYRVWHVDGEDVGEVEPGGWPPPEFYVRINQPPNITLAEFAAWLRLGPDPVPQDLVLDTIAGCCNPTPNFIDSDTPWGRASRLFDGLRNKGLVHYDHNTNTSRRLGL